ncbi:MAG: flagellar hook capping FlgD N-terminal domain-containing protein [Stenotrophomonas sp.]
MLASNFETFLSLLTTQLKNQDPLSPVDSNEFTAQLTQMAGVEQQLLTNDLLTSLLVGPAGRRPGQRGRTTSARTPPPSGPPPSFDDGKATLELRAGQPTRPRPRFRSWTPRVRWSGTAPRRDKTNGLHDFTWDGKTTGRRPRSTTAASIR